MTKALLDLAGSGHMFVTIAIIVIPSGSVTFIITIIIKVTVITFISTSIVAIAAVVL